MSRIRFTDNIQRHIACSDAEVSGTTVREALDVYFTDHAEARGYVLDDQGALRKHMAIFVDGRPINDRQRLSDAVSQDSFIDVMQALSGG